MNVTGEKNIQAAVDYFVEVMQKENIPAEKILVYINRMMQKALPPPKE